jgi:MFS family permease
MGGAGSDDDEQRQEQASGRASSESRALLHPGSSSSDDDGGGGSSCNDDGFEEDHDHQHQERSGRSQCWLLGAMALVAACFGFLFAGYSSLEILATTFHGELGYYSMMCVYAGITPGSFMLPAVVANVGCEWSMRIGAVPYTVFAAANYLVITESASGWILLPTGFCVGLGCGMLWGAQGLYLMQLSREYDLISESPSSVNSRGLFSGAGGAGTPVGGLLALAGSSLMMQHSVSNSTIVFCLFVCLALGNLLLFAVPSATQKKRRQSGSGRAKEPRVSCCAIPRLLSSSRLVQFLWRARMYVYIIIIWYISHAVI